MYKYSFTLLFAAFFSLFSPLLAQKYTADILGSNFEQYTFSPADSWDGPIEATVIRANATPASQQGILYIHGYNDYFFQEEMAHYFNDKGYNFYALDLHRFGRSLRTHQKAFEVHNLNEYFAEIDSAIYYMKKAGNEKIILMGHSTGGLIAAYYCDQHRTNLPVEALILNSPFLDMNLSWWEEYLGIPILSCVGKFFPYINIKQGNSDAYARSLLQQFNGEWQYNTTWKKVVSPSITTGWIHAIYSAQRKLHKGADIPCPILLMRSSNSVKSSVYTSAHSAADVVLDIKDISKYGKRLGKNITEVVIPGGLHDLVLSSPATRKVVLLEMTTWLKANTKQ